MMMIRAFARQLRRIADRLDPPPPQRLLNRRREDSVRTPEERLESLQQMVEARRVMQSFEDQVSLITRRRRDGEPVEG